ncbi:MAG: hypothetical protein K8T20_00225 [Planctomycetes bacterium]|nr:hypothetical protein [Planctomycetota bacterium]
MKVHRAALLFLAALAGCNRGPGAPPLPARPTDAQAAESAWKRWQGAAQGADGSTAWACLSKRTRSDRAAFYKADSARVKSLTGAALESEARNWGVAASSLATMGPDEFAAAALSREFRRASPGAQFTGVTVNGDLAIIAVKHPDGRPESVALIREDNGWRLDDVESRRLAGR